MPVVVEEEVSERSGRVEEISQEKYFRIIYFNFLLLKRFFNMERVPLTHLRTCSSGLDLFFSLRLIKSRQDKSLVSRAMVHLMSLSS